MADILDEIIELLSPSTLEIIYNYKSDSLCHSAKLNKTLNKTEMVRMKRLEKELQRSIVELKSRTTENTSLVKKLENFIDNSKYLCISDQKKYDFDELKGRLNEYQVRIKEAEQSFGDFNARGLFSDIEILDQNIKEIKNKIEEERKKYQCYENFPSSIQQAEEEIEKVKERIKSHNKEI